MDFQPICGYENYLISKDGVIVNSKGKVMRTRLDKYGYERINLQKDNKKNTEKIHKLLMTTFNPIPNANNMTIDHVDGDCGNNNLSNLRWVYLGENLNLKQLKSNDELLFFINELNSIYSDNEMSEILKTLLNLARILKS